MSRKTVESWENENGEREHEPCLSANQIREQKKKEGDERNARYRSQFSSLQQELDYCLKVGGRSKQVRKLKEKIANGQK